MSADIRDCLARSVERHPEERDLREAHDAAIDLIVAGRALSKALQALGYPMSDEMWRNVGEGAPVAHQAALEHQVLHKAAVAFNAEIAAATGKVEA